MTTIPDSLMNSYFLNLAFSFLPKLVSGIFIFSVFYIVGHVLKKILYRFFSKKTFDNFYVANLFMKIIHVAIVIFGLLTALGTMGVNVTALVAGIGLTGFGLGYALKDALSNVLAGIMIMVYRPFRPNETISVCTYMGVVTSIDLRYTTLKTDTTCVLIPNATMLTNPVTVHSEQD